jgi:hypothetical protein
MPKFICTHCHAEHQQMTPDGFCTNQPQCEYGAGWLKEVRDGETAATAVAPPVGFEREVGLCILLMDGSLSMGDFAFPNTDYPGNKYKLVSMNAAGGIWTLKNITQAGDAHIALCVFGGKPRLVWVKSVQEITAEFGAREKLADFLEQTLITQTPDPRVTNINEALRLAHAIHQAFLRGDLSEFGGAKNFKPLSHKVVKQNERGEEEFVSIPNARALIYTDGEHNVTAAIRNPFNDEPQSILLSAFIGEEDSPGVQQMQKLANTCPRHAPAKGFFLINSPERVQTLKGLFRMASGASGFCPCCLLQELALTAEPAPAEATPTASQPVAAQTG